MSGIMKSMHTLILLASLVAVTYAAPSESASSETASTDNASFDWFSVSRLLGNVRR